MMIYTRFAFLMHHLIKFNVTIRLADIRGKRMFLIVRILAIGEAECIPRVSEQFVNGTKVDNMTNF